MTELKSFNDASLVIGLLTPGLIITYVRSQFLTGRLDKGSDLAIQYLTLSVLYYALVFPGIEFLHPFNSVGYPQVLSWFLLIFVGPAIFGLLLGIEAQKNIIRTAFRFAGLNPVHVIPTAWDWKFSNMTEQRVLVTLKNGTRFAGLCGCDSFASSEPSERDLYLERIYSLDSNNVWSPRDAGALIIAEEISTIEFWDN